MLRVVLGCVLIALPVLELTLLVKTGQVIGFWATLALVVAAGLLGALILSHQGWGVVRRARAAMAQGRPPVAAVVDGLFLVLAGALLITPGFLTDVMALLLLIPPVRHSLARWGIRRLVRQAQHVRVNASGAKIEGEPRPAPSQAGGTEGPVIEGEFERLDEKATGPHRRNDRDRV